MFRITPNGAQKIVRALIKENFPSGRGPLGVLYTAAGHEGPYENSLMRHNHLPDPESARKKEAFDKISGGEAAITLLRDLADRLDEYYRSGETGAYYEVEEPL